MKTKILIVTAVFAAVFFTSCQSETVTSGNISGIVSDFNTGKPFITLMPTGKNAYTGMDGDFEFTDLEAEQYRINVQKQDYESGFKVANVMAGETTTVFIAMLKNYSE